ncbi:MgtC/SapB family protein [Corynebacterium ulceribovis]|uniref:MgtC/SapB family protein n=1 Tax=Corynebacterium ulceribovis TaxID=487732 RepID=UPI00037B71F7|nr:MgtC/SapB family protein [Corynebacterium ulceribovis]
MHQLLANEFVDALGGPNIVQHIGGIALAALLGALLGAEREWRAKDAGLRTTTLVSMGAALFTIVGMEAVDSAGTGDPTRVASQIVSGIGFLGAGVIIKHGASVKGLTTAATMWAAAAVGALCGASLHLLAIVGAVMIVFTNIAMRPVVKTIEHKSPNVHEESDPA